MAPCGLQTRTFRQPASLELYLSKNYRFHSGIVLVVITCSLFPETKGDSLLSVFLFLFFYFILIELLFFGFESHLFLAQY